MTVDTGTATTEFVDCNVTTHTGRRVRVTGQPTACPHLLITPRVAVRADGTLSFTDGLVLAHAPTGRIVVGGESVTRLLRLAELLAGFDWSFTDFDNVASDTLKLIGKVVQRWRLEDASSIPGVLLYGETEAQRAERESAPARALLVEHLEWWQRHNEIRVMATGASVDPATEQAWRDGVTTSVEGYGVIYLMAVLWRTNPTVADIAARMLTLAWDAGDSMGEWVYQWRKELADNHPLTLHAIPEADPLESLASVDRGSLDRDDQ